MLPNSTAIQQFVFYDKYSRYNYDLGRRERWEETIRRVTDHLRWMSYNKLTDENYQEIYDLMYKGVVSPSMRLMATAGEAARKNVLLGYNCAFLPIVSLPCFGEVLWLSMSGVGVGYSVERKYVDLLPVVKESDPVADTVKFIVEDSAEGWVAAFNLAIHLFWSGNDVEFDYSHIRPAGAPLRTKGGQASGPEPLEYLMESARKIIRGAVGRKLRPVEVFDLLTVIGGCAVSGGHRRSAQICLFSRDDEEMRTSKDGAFWDKHPYRVNANISAVWEEELTREQIAEQMNSMYAGQSGEPGIVSRYAMKMSQPERRRELVHGGTNPCQPSFATVLTPDGIARFSEVGIGDTIWSGHEWTTIINKWSTGVKPVYRYLTNHGEFVGTENHRVFQNGERVEVKDAVSIDVSPLPSWNSIDDPRPIGPVTPSSEIRSRSYLGEYEVFDITVSADSHSYWTGGLKVSNCGEVFLHGTTKQGEFGGQLCNLSAVNVKPNMSLHEIEQAARVAAMIGTIQAAATDFRLLRPAWKEIC